MTVFVIAEIGVNHNGSLERAFKLIDAAKDSGADAVKFQTFKAKRLVTSTAQKAEYQKKNAPSNESQYEMLSKLELTNDDHFQLSQYTKTKGIEFMSSAFDIDSLKFLIEDIGIKKIKIPSGEITNSKLLLASGKSKLEIFLSTGMSKIQDIDDALGILAFGLTDKKNPNLKNFRDSFKSKTGNIALKEKVTLLHCTTEYPTPSCQVNLNVLETLKNRYELRLGLSDHSLGNLASIASVGMGVRVIEKHFTLDKTSEGPDHRASTEPQEFKDLISSIREVETILGKANKEPTTIEIDNASVARKSLVAISNISKGEKFSSSNIGMKRPGNGINPIKYFDYLGRVSEKDYRIDELINIRIRTK